MQTRPQSSVSYLTVISRAAFDRLTVAQKGTNIYLVKEGSDDNYPMLSLYVGNAKKTDIEELDYNVILNYASPANPSHITNDHYIKNKLYFYKQELENDSEGNKIELYRVVAWDGLRFLDIFSKQNNVVICTSLPETSEEDIVYINVHDKSVFVYHNGEYIEISSTDIYATVEEVNEMEARILDLIKEITG